MFGWSSKSDEAFYAWYTSDIYLRIVDNDELYCIQQRVIQIVAKQTYGSYACSTCLSRGKFVDADLEGHHISPGHMKISEYRHCYGYKRRQAAVQRLVHEMERHVVLLCKQCHEVVHHRPTADLRV